MGGKGWWAQDFMRRRLYELSDTLHDAREEPKSILHVELESMMTSSQLVWAGIYWRSPCLCQKPQKLVLGGFCKPEAFGELFGVGCSCVDQERPARCGRQKMS